MFVPTAKKNGYLVFGIFLANVSVPTVAFL